MSEPRRLLEEPGSEFERMLLEAGAGYTCPESGRRKVLVGLGLASSTAAVSSVGTALLIQVVSESWLKVVLGLSTVGVLATVPLSMMNWGVGNDDTAREVPTVLSPRVSMQRPEIIEGRSAGEVVQPAVAQTDASVQTPPPIKPRPTRSRVATLVKERSKLGLADELRALDRARASLASGNAGQALTILADYRRLHPRGHLTLEAEVLRIDSLAASGRRDEAERRARRFLRDNSKSVLAPRVRRSLTGE